MKNFTHGLAIVIALFSITTIFSSCNEDQTSFSLEEIETTATITGTLFYSEGETYSNENVVEKIKSAVGKKIYVEINNAQLYPQGKAKGYSTFETTTDQYGNYQIEVPTVAIGHGVEVSIKAENFTGQQTMLGVNEEGEIISKEKEVIFTSSTKIHIIKPNDFLIVDIKYNATERNPEEEATPMASLRVKIGVGALEPHSYYDYGYPYFTFKAGIKAAVTVSYEEYKNGGYIAVEKKYAGITDDAGEFIIQFPVADKSGFISVLLEASSFRENNFISYSYYNEPITISGIYQMYNRRSFVQYQRYDLVYYDEEAIPTIEARMVLEADYGQSHNYYPHNYSWENLPFEY